MVFRIQIQVCLIQLSAFSHHDVYWFANSFIPAMHCAFVKQTDKEFLFIVQVNSSHSSEQSSKMYINNYNI